MPPVSIALVLAAFAVAALAVAVAPLIGRGWRRRLTRYVPVGLIGRRYVVWLPVPRRRKTPVPVVLAFHGEGAAPEEFEAQAALHTIGAAQDLAVVYPEGYHGTWNAGRCCGDAMRSAIDEATFVRRILADLERLVRVDRRRIYATGFSNGAMLCYFLAGTMSEEIAAIAPVGGGMALAECDPRRPVAIFHLHGGADEIMPYAGGAVEDEGGALKDGALKGSADESSADEESGMAPGGRPSIPDAIAFWRAVNGTLGARRTTLFAGEAEGILYAAGPGSDGAEIALCTIPGLGHHWPGSGAEAPRLDRNAVNEAILGFLTRHSLSERTPRRIRLDADTAGARAQGRR